MPSCDPVGLDFAAKASVVGRVEVVVAASPTQVWQVLNDTERWPEWFDGMKSAKVTSAEWDGIGSTRNVRVGPLVIEEEMIGWEPEQLWGFFATNLNVTGWIAKRMLETVEIQSEGSGSRLIYTGALDPVLWLKPIGGLIRRNMVKAWTSSLPNIDRQIASL